MKRKLRTFFMACMLMLLAGICMTSQTTYAKDDFVSGDFQYTLDNDGDVSITGYTGHNIDVVIPSRIDGKLVTSIGESAFAENLYLHSVIVPGTVTEIRRRAFYKCTSLKDVDLPSSVKTLGTGCFAYCSGITRLDLPDSISEIGASAFYSCKNMYILNIPSRVKRVENSLANNCTSLETVILPENVTYIGNNAFKNCNKLTSINLPDGISQIGENAFWSCSSLTSIKLPNSITEISDSMFNFCESLLSVYIPNNVKKINEHAFYGCKSLTSLELPDGLEEIAPFAFDSAGNMSYLVIPASVTKIGQCAFDTFSKKTDCAIYFKGDRPAFHVEAAFQSANLDLYYPEDNDTWNNVEETDAYRYVTWIPYSKNNHDHIIKVIPEVEAGCITDGSSEGKVCPVCDEVLQDPIKIPATGHVWSDWYTFQEVNVLTDGIIRRVCATCKENDDKYIAKPAPTIRLTLSELPLQVKKSVYLSSFVTDLSPLDSVVSWTTSDSKIATVKFGKVTAGSKTGAVRITAYTKAGANATFTIKVQKALVKTTKLTSSAKKLRLKVKETYRFVPGVVPVTSGQKVSFSSSNRSVVSVSTSGKVGILKGRKKGSATITIKSGTKSLKIKVTVG